MSFLHSCLIYDKQESILINQYNAQSNTSLILMSASTLLSLLLNVYSSLQNQSGCKVTNLARPYRFMSSSHVDFFPVKNPTWLQVRRGLLWSAEFLYWHRHWMLSAQTKFPPFLRKTQQWGLISHHIV